MNEQLDNLSQEIDIVRKDLKAIYTILTIMSLVGGVAIIHFW